MAGKIGYKDLVAEAEQRIETITVEAALASFDSPDVVFVDLRDVRELKREGKIPGAFHCPRGLLEFWIDAESPYYNKIFGEDKRFIFYCNLGWRSALAKVSATLMVVSRPGRMQVGQLKRNKTASELSQ
jgi:rhodanese-related sulfurtransferase